VKAARPPAFLKDAGIYVPADDGVKFTAIVDDHERIFIATREAMVAAGASPTADPASMVDFFERHRDRFELAALDVMASPGAQGYVRAENIRKKGTWLAARQRPAG
jgi:hypothetical protein